MRGGVTRMLARTGRALAALAAAAILAGCHFAVVPPKPHAHASGRQSMRNPYGARLADAPALLTQCLVTRSGLRPGQGLDWLRGRQVRISSTNAADFRSWWDAHSMPGPYPQTFRIAGHLTHYLEFGTAWVRHGGLWVPVPAGNTNPRALRYSLRAWANWTAVNGKLPPPVCGTSVTARQLQHEIFGTGTPNPW